MQQKTSTPARAARLRRGWTLRDLAGHCAEKGVPVDHGQLARIERGESIPRPRLRAVLAELLGIDAVDDFRRTA
jgi:transcriptional regulator with XRE-family HTH domain